MQHLKPLDFKWLFDFPPNPPIKGRDPKVIRYFYENINPILGTKKTIYNLALK